MSQRVDPNLLYELKEYGALGAEKCISCGNCTAICNLSTNDDPFPRHMVRMVQLGLKDELLASKELWLCYNCGDCSETCPQQAEPANLMSAARSYAIAHYAPFKIGELFSRKPFASSLIATLMVLFFGLFMLVESQSMATDALRLFGFIPYEFIHNLGLAVIILIGLISLTTIFNMMSRIARANHLSAASFFRGDQRNWLQAFWEAAMVQSLWQERYRQDCAIRESQQPWYLRKWFVHAATMWGFLGLLFATALNYLLDIIGVKATGTFVPLWYPTRLIGTLSGLVFIYGVSILLYKRLKSVDKSHSFSRPADWLFLVLLWLSGMSGFLIEIALYLPGAPIWGYWTFISHVAVSITLLLLLPFTKFAHAFYRIVALYVQALKPVPRQEPAPASTD